MKKFSLLLCLCLTALIVPQRIVATVIITEAGSGANRVVTIQTDLAGELASHVFTSADIAKMDAPTIKFTGKFDSRDLKRLSDAGYCTASTVDMADAIFIKTSASSNTYKLFSSMPDCNAGNSGDVCIVGGTLYTSALQSTSYAWNSISQDDYDNQSSNKEEPTTWAFRDLDSHRSDFPNKYVKLVDVALYYKLIIKWELQSDPLENATPQDNTSTPPNNEGEKIRVPGGYNYYHVETVDNVLQYVPVSSDASESFDNGWYLDSEKDSHISEYNNRYVKFVTYFKYYLGVKAWTSLAESEIGSSSVNYVSWVDDKDNHLSDYSKDAIIGIAKTYKYFHVIPTDFFNWVAPATSPGYTDGDNPFINYHFNTEADKDAHVPSNENEKALVGGTEYIHDGDCWVSYSSAVQEPDYSQMKFTYWGTNITKAITSKDANTSISNQLFDGCTNLTEVEYLSGNVTGFADKNAAGNYKINKVIIGKDVTQIDPAAFMRCDVLKTVEFDKDYTGLTSTDVKTLTIGSEAFLYCTELQAIEIPNRVTSIGNNAFQGAGTGSDTGEFVVSFERRSTADDETVGINYNCELIIGESAFEDCTTIKSISLPIRLSTMGSKAFKNTTSLETLDMRETGADYAGPRLTTIPSEAFQGSHMKSVTIPLSVTLIESSAFGATNYLNDVYIQTQKVGGVEQSGQPALRIKSGAFSGGSEEIVPNLTVHVNVDPTKRLIICEYNAFTFTEMEGQTDVENSHRAVLDFNEEYWDYYQGNWKRGLSFSQTNLNAFKDGYTDGDKCMGKYNGDLSDINSTTGKYEYNEVGKEDGEYTPGNGWQMFAGTSTGIDLIIPSGTFIRTYCTNKTYEIPKVHVNNVLTYLVSVYRIINFSDGYNESDPNADINSAEQAAAASRSATALLVRNISSSGEFAGEPCYIPKNTGLIMVGNVDAGSGYLTYFKDRDESSDEPTYTYQQDVSVTSTVNLLEPTGDGITPIVVNPTEPYPIWSIDSEPANNYRIFGLAALQVEGVSKYSFGRMRKNQTMPENRAYLKLPVSLFHWANERVGTGPTYNDTPSSDSRLSLLFSDEVDNNELTGIAAMSGNTVGNGNYYTIQGVKVTRPQGKGLFIHNGKKIIIK